MQAQLNRLSFTEIEAEAERPGRQRLREHLEWVLLHDCLASAVQAR